MFTRLKNPFSASRKAYLSAIYIAPGAGAPLEPRETALALEHRGLEGDRYALQRGYWKVIEACELTLISERDIQRAIRRGGSLRLQQGAHRRNLVIADLSTSTLSGKEFAIGEAAFHYHKPRPPCGYLDQVEGRGLAKALGRNSGICIQVIRSGVIRVGDPLTLL